MSDLKALRAPFPPESIGSKPQPYKADSAKGNCPECGKYHGLPAVHLDYVGHAVVTGRLLDVDPGWSWEPLGVDAQGLPAFDRAGNLWIKLTILGVTRIGVGDGPNAKVAIGDAIRNAAMRFGVALDLWAKEDLESPRPSAEDFRDRALATTTVDELLSLYEEVKRAHLLAASVADANGEIVTLGALVTARGKELRGTT